VILYTLITHLALAPNSIKKWFFMLIPAFLTIFSRNYHFLIVQVYVNYHTFKLTGNTFLIILPSESIVF
jgi:hypothetical protein